MHLRIVSYYRPNDTTTGTALSVVAQHRRYFYDHDDDRHPRQAFLEDLHIELSKFQADGDLLIVCGDMNQDVLSPEIQAYFSSLHLRNHIFSRHDSSLAPATMDQVQIRRCPNSIN